MALDLWASPRPPPPPTPPLRPVLYRKTSPDNFLFLSFLILFYSKKANTDRLQRINNIEKMNKREGKAKVLSSFRKDVFSIVLTSKLWAFLLLVLKKKVLSFFSFSAWEEQCCEHAGQRVTQTAADTPPTPPPRREPITSSRPRCSASDSKLYKEQKTRFIFHRSLCIFHNILFIIILINTKRHCDFF